jgi:protease-4
MTLMLGQIWEQMVGEIAESRHISKDVLNQAATSLTFLNPKEALKANALDGLKYYDEVLAVLNEKLGKSLTDKTTFVQYADYREMNREMNLEMEEEDYIAVVYAVGEIQQGKGSDDVIGSDRIAAALRKARLDEHAKAVVLRVNSPGGSALASDVIWRETELIRQSGKPFVVSMGDYAASGGYYIACNANRIFANPTTITGSIGVFGVIPNMQKFLNNKIGLTFDTYKTNAHAGMLSVTKPLDPEEMKAMQDIIAGIYDDFTSKVANGRGKTQAQVDSIGQGRVWSGEDALQLGLVDELGGLNQAIASAAGLAGLSDYGLVEYPKLKDPFQEFVEELTGQKQTSLMKEVLGDQYGMYVQLQSVQKMKGPQARIPFLLEIK